MNKEKLSKKIAKQLGYYVSDTDRRCTDVEGRCNYSGKSLGIKAKGCFVGSLLPLKDRLVLDKFIGGIPIWEIKYTVKEHGVVLPKYMRDNMELFSHLQSLHDVSSYWSMGEGLSAEGKDKVEYLIAKFDLIEEDFVQFLD